MRLDLDVGGKESEQFEQAYAVFPRHEGKKDALKAWGQTSRARPPLLLLLQAIRKATAANRWTPDRRQFTPLFATWLRGERWNDEFPEPVPTKLVQDPIALHKAAAMRAWAEVRNVNRGAPMPAGGWTEPHTAYALASLGGLTVLADMTTRDVPFRQREFLAFYMARASEPISPAQQPPAALRLVTSR